MKKEIKKNITLSFKNAQIIVEEGNVVIIEKDKDGYIVNEIGLLDAIEFLLEEDGLDIVFKKSKTDDVVE